jgi:hypothetical protein
MIDRRQALLDLALLLATPALGRVRTLHHL